MMNISVIIVTAFILDMVFKDPQKIPHFVTFIGMMIKKGEAIIRKIFISSKWTDLFGGFLLTVFVVFVSFIIPYLLLGVLYAVNSYLGAAVEIFLCFQILALGSLKEAAMRVYSSFSLNSLDMARKEVSKIVGRDTENLTEKEVVKATVESVAENTNDGVVAPLFYMLIGGASLGMLYKAVNTLDSMIGYRNKKYNYFGRFAARLDDVLNIIPARITGFLYVAASLLSGFDYKNAYRILLRDRWNHLSPNSGYPEAAVAGALNIQLGGGSYYSGEYVEKKYIGDDNKEPDIEDIPKACMLMTFVSVLALVILIALKIAVMMVINYDSSGL